MQYVLLITQHCVHCNKLHSFLTKVQLFTYSDTCTLVGSSQPIMVAVGLVLGLIMCGSCLLAGIWWKQRYCILIPSVCFSYFLCAFCTYYLEYGFKKTGLLSLSKNAYYIFLETKVKLLNVLFHSIEWSLKIVVYSNIWQWKVAQTRYLTCFKIFLSEKWHFPVNDWLIDLSALLVVL